MTHINKGPAIHT